jgi:DoxX-like family
MASTLATSTVYTGTRPSTAWWVGASLTALVVAFLVFDAAVKFTANSAVVSAFAQLGYPLALAPVIATLEIVCLVVYLVPRTSLLGALLWTGYLGGAIATHLRVGNPLFSHTLFPIYVAVLIWGGLVLRDADLRVFLLRRVQS